MQLGHRLEPHIADTAPIAWRTLDRGDLVVFEGAQGTMLDIDHGTYPFVTSSNPVAGAACVGAGVGPSVDRRGVGNRQGLRHARGRRPLPHGARRRTRRADPRGRRRVRHHHRPRRGAPAGSTWWRSATPSRVNGFTGLVVTKLDVLTGIDPLHVATRYLGPEGATFDEFPYHQSIVHKARGELVELPGWHEDITGCRSHRGAAAQRPGLPGVHQRLPGRPDRDGRRGPGRDEMIWTGAAERVRSAAA